MITLKELRLIWNSLRFIYAYGPDIAERISRERKFDECMSAALTNWMQEAYVLLPHRYTVILGKLYGAGYITKEAHDRRLLSKFCVIDGVTFVVGADGVPSPLTEDDFGDPWQAILPDIPKDIREKIREYESDHAYNMKYAQTAFYWILELKVNMLKF